MTKTLESKPMLLGSSRLLQLFKNRQEKSNYPMSVEEFLLAIGKKYLLKILQSGDWNQINSLRSEFTENLRMYYFTGGMPLSFY